MKITLKFKFNNREERWVLFETLKDNDVVELETLPISLYKNLPDGLTWFGDFWGVFKLSDLESILYRSVNMTHKNSQYEIEVG